MKTENTTSTNTLWIDGKYNSHNTYFGTHDLQQVQERALTVDRKNRISCAFYRLTSNIVSKNLHFILKTLILDANNKKKNINEGVSVAKGNARTHMAQAKKTNSVISAVAGAAFAATSLLAPSAASAQEIKVAEASNVATTEQLSPELLELHRASLAAGEYAENNYGVGILIHIGNDIPNSHFSSGDDFGHAMVRLFQEKYGTDAQYFLSQNDAKATVLEFYIDEYVHGADNGTEIKLVGEAIAAAPEVVGLLKSLKADKVAQLSSNISSPQPGGS